MKNSFKPLFVIFIVAVVLSVIIRPRAGGKGIVPWRKDLPAAREEAGRIHKPLFVEFSASWCGPCQQMISTTWSDKSVAAALEKMVPVQIDVDSHPEIAREFGVNPIPAYIVLDPAGNVLKSGEGYRDPEDFIAWLNASAGGP